MPLLLQRCSDPAPEVKQAVCECIGELGAIDPGYFQSSDTPSQLSVVPVPATAASSSSASAASKSAKSFDLHFRSVNELLPLVLKPHMNMAGDPQRSSGDSTPLSSTSQLSAQAHETALRAEDDRFALTLINHFLVRAHSAAPTPAWQNSTLYTIQELLKVLGCVPRTAKLYEQHKATVNVQKLPEVIAAMRAEERANLEPYARGIENWAQLSERARDVCAPCLTTEYGIQKKSGSASASAAKHNTAANVAAGAGANPMLLALPPTTGAKPAGSVRALLAASEDVKSGGAAVSGLKPPIFRVTLPFERWLARWCSDLAEKATGPRAWIFRGTSSERAKVRGRPTANLSCVVCVM